MSSFEFAVPTRLKSVRVIPSPSVSSEKDGGTDYQKGFEAGYRSGEWKAKAELEKLRKKQAGEIGVLLDKLERVNHALLVKSEEHLSDLVLLAVNRLFQRHYFTPEQIAGEVERLLKELTQAEQIMIECSPEELEKIQKQVELLGLTPGKGRLAWKANPSILTGEFMLQSDLGSVDGRKVSRLAHLRAVLEGEYHEKNLR